MSKTFKVSEVNNYIKKILSSDWILSNISIEGEISNFTHHYSGHMYFTLKDEKSRLRCVMFSRDNKSLDLKVEEGLKIICTGSISVYEKDGTVQLYVKKMEKSGIGDLYKAFEELKNKLEREGLFDLDRKKPIPLFPKKIGVVTSSTGAAVRDIINVTKRRYKIANILIYPTLVQGDMASSDICKGLRYLDKRDDIDVIIVGRGGGSFEELNAFNSEDIARTISKMVKPVISAVGHETDNTITDFVSDLRAPTPSAAAELATPDLNKLNENKNAKISNIHSIMKYLIQTNKKQIERFSKNMEYLSPQYSIRQRAQELDLTFRKMNNILEKDLINWQNKLEIKKDRLFYLNPKKILNRGYGIILDEKNNPIKSINYIEENQKLKILLADGRLEVKVEKKVLGDE